MWGVIIILLLFNKYGNSVCCFFKCWPWSRWFVKGYGILLCYFMLCEMTQKHSKQVSLVSLIVLSCYSVFISCSSTEVQGSHSMIMFLEVSTLKTKLNWAYALWFIHWASASKIWRLFGHEILYSFPCSPQTYLLSCEIY